MQELQAQVKRDESLLKKTMSDNERPKRESKRPAAPPKSKEEVPDVEEMKSKFMDRLTLQLENIFDEPSQQEKDLSSQIVEQTQNSSLDEK